MISFDTVPGNAVASADFIEQKGVRAGMQGMVIPHRLAILGQYNDGKTPTVNVPHLITSEADAINLYGRGSLLHLMLRKAIEQAPAATIYAIPLADGTTAGTGTIVVTGAATGAGTIALFIGGQKVSVAIASGDTTAQIATKIDAAIDAALDLPVTSAVTDSTVTLTSKYKGAIANDIRIQRDLDSGDLAAEPAGFAATIAATLSSGATNPNPTTALGLLGGTWFTAIVCPYQDATSISAIEAAAATRAGSGVKMPFGAFFGYTGAKADFQTAVAARNSPYAVWVPAEDSPSLPQEVAACAGALFVSRQQAKPGSPMKGVTLVGIRAGQAAAWSWTDQQATVMAGGSTTRNAVDGSVVTIDLATTYKLNALGAADATYRFAGDWLGNWQAKLYSLDALFNADPFIDSVVVDDGSMAKVAHAIRPKTVKAYVISLIDGLWVPLALTKERDAVVNGLIVEIDASNPGRINVFIPDVFAAGLRIIATKVQWGFYAPAVAA